MRRRKASLNDDSVYTVRAIPGPTLRDDRTGGRETLVKPGGETYNRDGQWRSRRQGSDQPFAVGGTKAEQQQRGQDAARRVGVEHIIRNLDGTIDQTHSYGNDLNLPKDS
ncbi:DUF2188 domain-containing protein [Paenarthrobacter sp. NPDC090517]|uniref:DUF2188 domain-containing protein n=1 Tax=Paenarthrobacter sp. NPDC090517 TaxID=3364381 RepID=UPI0038258179